MTAAERATVARLQARGAEALAGGDTATALRLWHQARGLVVGVLRTDSATAEDHLTLGRLCSAIGEALLDEGDAVRAAAVLHRGLLAYRTLADEPLAGTDPDASAADVRLLLAKAYELRGWPASALVEAQAGLTTYLDRWSGQATEPAALDVARALVFQGWTTMQVGDPDIAAAAFDTSITIHLGSTAAFDADPDLSQRHDDLFRQATLASYLIHAGRDRPEAAERALELLRALDPTLAERAERLDTKGLPISRRLSLPEALEATGATAPRRRLLEPVGRSEVLTSSHRGPPDQLLLAAMTLHKELRRAIDSEPAAARRILLEIHTMLAAGATADWRLRIAPPTAPLAWVSALMDGARLAELTGDRRLAADLHRWLHHLTLDLRNHASTDGRTADALVGARCWLARRSPSPLALS